MMESFGNSLKISIYSPNKLQVTIQFAGSQRKCEKLVLVNVSQKGMPMDV
jgi:hypothetical protein